MGRKPKALSLEDAARAVIVALESGEYLRGAKCSRDLGKTWQDAPYLEQLKAALSQDEPADDEPAGVPHADE